MPFYYIWQPLLEKLRIAERFDEIRQDLPVKSGIQITREWLFENYRDGAILDWERLTARLGEIAAGMFSMVIYLTYFDSNTNCPLL